MRLRLLLSALFALLGVQVAVAAPISTYPAATSPLSGSEQMIATQAGQTVNVTPAQIGSFATTTTGPYAHQLPQTTAQRLVAAHLNIFDWLTASNQQTVLAGANTFDIAPILTYLTTAYTAPGGTAAPTIDVPCGYYYIGSTFVPTQTFRMVGGGGGAGLAGTSSCTILHFAANIEGFQFNLNYGGAHPGANGASLENLKIEDSSSSMGATPDTNPAIGAQVRVSLKNININWSAGTGYYVNANFNNGVGYGGNANESDVDNVNIIATHGYCFHVKGADTNGGEWRNVGAQSCGLGGMISESFLGFALSGYHGDQTGTMGLGSVTQSGHVFECMDPTGTCPTTTPTVDMKTPWLDDGTGTGPPAFVLNNPYYPSQCLLSTSPDANSTLISGFYCETGTGTNRIQSPAIAIGGSICQTQFTNDSPCIFSGFGIGGAVFSLTGMGGFAYNHSGDQRGADSFAFAAPTFFEIGNSAGGYFQFGTSSNFWGPIDLVMGDNVTGKVPFVVTGNGTPFTFGRSSTTGPDVLWVYHGFAIGEQSDDARLIHSLTTAEYNAYTGQVAQGEKFFIVDAAVGAPAAYQVTTGGTIGSGAVLTPFGPLQPPAATVSTLATCTSGLKGAKTYVTDATSPTYLGTLTGGGSTVAPVFCNGSAWVSD